LSLLIPLDETKTRALFFSVPELVYTEDPLYVPDPAYWVRRQLSARRNPFFRHASCELVVVQSNGRPSARASIVFPHETPGEALFGFVESTPDDGVFGGLVAEMEKRCRRRGVERLVGPFAPNTYGVTGLQLDAFDTPHVFYEARHPHYYHRMFREAGFTVVQTGRAWRGVVPQVPDGPPPVQCGRYRVWHIRPGNMREAVRAVSSVFEVAFTENWYARHLSTPEYRYTALSLLPALCPRLIQWVELDGMAVGAAIVLLNINQVMGGRSPRSLAGALSRVWRRRRRITTATVLAVGMLPSHRNSRGGHLLYTHLRRELAAFRCVTTTWITEGNRASEAVAAHLGMRPYKTFAVMEKRL